MSKLTRLQILGIAKTSRNLVKANLTDLDLSGADLRGVNLRDSNLSGSNLQQANIKHTKQTLIISEQIIILRRAHRYFMASNSATSVKYCTTSGLICDY